MSEAIYTSGEYFKKHPTLHIGDSPWKAKQILTIIERNHLKPQSICEIGCGAGEVLAQLYMHMPANVSFTGYEISPQAYELCKQRSNPSLCFHLKDLFEDTTAYFDIILAIDVIEHIEDYMGFLRKLRTKGLYKIFHIPLNLSVQTILRRSALVAGRKAQGHIHCFTKETAIATLADTGYEIIDSYYTAGSIEKPAKSFKSLLARLPRRIMYSFNKDMAVRILGGYSLIVLAK